MNNKLKYWRHQHEMERKEFAEYLGVSYNHYTKWESNVVQPTADKLIYLWQRIKTKYPDTNLQDLLEL